MSKKVLLVDDEPKVTILLKDYIEKEDVEVITANNGKDAIALFHAYEDSIDMVLLDVMMPDLDGWTVCREIRKNSDVYIIMITARSEDYDEIHGFEIGADDYVTKPVKPAALVARINAFFRRDELKHNLEDIQIGDITINKESHVVTINDEEIALSPKEFELLLLLAENRGKVISREQLLNKVWGYEYYGALRTVDTHINRLRAKLVHEGCKVNTVRGYGYRFE